nr:hypothetical protein [Tanacetum cinerariifolium]
MIEDLDADEVVALVDETQGRNDQDMFDKITTAGEVVTTAGVEVSTTAITSQISLDDVTLAKALVDIKTSKPKAKGVVIQEPSETPTPTPTPIDSSQQSSKAKDKGKAKMIEPEKPLKKKDQIMIDEEMLFNNTIKWIDSFVPMDTELVKGREKAVKGSEKAKEGSSKIKASNLEQEDAKRQRIEEDNEFVELKRCLEIIPKDNDDMRNDVRLQFDYEVEMAYDLLRLIRRQINEGYVPE